MKIKNRHNENGFTLIEILVVVVILGLLVGAVGPRIIKHVSDAKIVKARNDIDAFKSSLKSYWLDNGNYPDSEQGLQALVTAPESGKLPKKWRQYLDSNSVPKDPWDNEYIYICPGSNGDFDIISYGKDGIPGGEDEDKDITSWNAE